MLGRRAALIGVTLGLAGCGFSPVYAPGGQGDGLQGLILADAPDNRNAFDFVARFEERLGTGANARYTLRYKIQTRSEGVGITPAAETTRFNLFGAVTFAVIDPETDRQVTAGFVETFTGYSTTRFTVATQTAERDARERLMTILADQVVTRLISTAPDWLG